MTRKTFSSLGSAAALALVISLPAHSQPGGGPRRQNGNGQEANSQNQGGRDFPPPPRMQGGPMQNQMGQMQGGQGQMQSQMGQQQGGQNLQAALQNAGLTDSKMLSAITTFAAAQSAARQPIQSGVRQVMQQISSGQLSDQQAASLMKELRAALQAEKSRSANAEQQLDNAINYSNNPRLELLLTSLGLIGDADFLGAGGGPNGGMGGPGGMNGAMNNQQNSQTGMMHGGQGGGGPRGMGGPGGGMNQRGR